MVFVSAIIFFLYNNNTESTLIINKNTKNIKNKNTKSTLIIKKNTKSTLIQVQTCRMLVHKHFLAPTSSEKMWDRVAYRCKRLLLS